MAATAVLTGAAGAVIAAKKAHPHITLSLLLPYHPAERPVKTPKGFDGTYYPPGMEGQYAIVQANHYVIDHVDYLIAYAWHPASNARELVEYARRREKRHLIAVTVLKPVETNTRR